MDVDRLKVLCPGLDPNDIRIDHIRLEDGGSAYRVVHLPSGVSVQERNPERPTWQRAEYLLRELAVRLEGRHTPGRPRPCLATRSGRRSAT
jgi:hypothetical protein